MTVCKVLCARKWMVALVHKFRFYGTFGKVASKFIAGLIFVKALSAQGTHGCYSKGLTALRLLRLQHLIRCEIVYFVRML